MALHKDGVAVGCENCVFAGQSDARSFDVRVPITEQAGAFSGDALIRCEIAPEGHRLTLVSLRQAQAEVPVSPQARAHVQNVLDQVASHRVCGNEHVCPSEVVTTCRRIEGRRKDGCDPDA